MISACEAVYSGIGDKTNPHSYKKLNNSKSKLFLYQYAGLKMLYLKFQYLPSKKKDVEFG